MKILKSNYDKFIFKASLALELYSDMNGNKEIFNNFNEKLKHYRALPINDEKSKETIVKELIAIINKLGQKKFIIYEDVDVEYNYNIDKKDTKTINKKAY